MPRDKDLKRLVRTRMRKTGEAYTAARAQILKKAPSVRRRPSSLAVAASTGDSPPFAASSRVRRAAPAPSAAPPPGASSHVRRVAAPSAAPPLVADYATLAGMSDAAVEAKTGCRWEAWVFALDRSGAQTMAHRDIATLIAKKYKIDGWWAQAVTVGYERIKGLRAIGQRRDGHYEVNKSRTFNVPVDELRAAWADAGKRQRWFEGETVRVRASKSPKSLRLDWPGGGIVSLWFEPKGKSRSAVSVQHTKLPDRESAERLRAHWSKQLEGLGAYLASVANPRVAR
jgi:hypothetical protein